jgi:hypothetical protein
MSARLGVVISTVCLALAVHPLTATAANPCAEPHARALVLGSGGSKGAFEAGAAYHLIVQRGCDFSEISGISVGALNGAILAQAAVAPDAAQSLDNLRRQTEVLTKEWTGIKSQRDMLRPRPLGRLRVGLFGLQSLDKTDALKAFVTSRVSLDRLARGRELRVGTMTFDDGRYHEIVINPQGRVDRQTAHSFIYGSVVVPVFGVMPTIPSSPGQPSADQEQYSDAGVRHSTPVESYFESCRPACAPLTGPNTPPHPPTEQLFVVVTSPYARRDDLRPVVDPKAFDDDTRQITNGRAILVRMFDLLIDTSARNDLDDMLMLNDLLRWRTQAAVRLGSPLTGFPIESYNRSAGNPDAPSQPYDIALIAPQREDSDPSTIFDTRPSTIRRQLFCGCVAADQAMQRDFGLASMETQCADRFPRLATREHARRRDRVRETAPWDAAICRDPRTAVTNR